MPPSIVWMVPLRQGQPTETRGTLELGNEALLFTEHGSGRETAFAFAELRRARRVRGSPVLLVAHERDGERRQTAFYFAQPPPLIPPEPGREPLPGGALTGRPAGAFGAMRRTGRRRHQRANIGYLATASGGKKQEIRAWVVEIRRRMSPGGGA